VRKMSSDSSQSSFLSSYYTDKVYELEPGELLDDLPTEFCSPTSPIYIEGVDYSKPYYERISSDEDDNSDYPSEKKKKKSKNSRIGLRNNNNSSRKRKRDQVRIFFIDAHTGNR